MASRRSLLSTIGARSAISSAGIKRRLKTVRQLKTRTLAPPASSSFLREVTSSEVARTAFSTTSTGKNTWDHHFNLPFVASYLPNAPNGAAGLPATTAADPNWPIVKLNRNLSAQTPNAKSYHIHGTPVYMERANSGIVFVWGENERLKAYNYDFATKRIASFSAQGTQVASGNDPGMPGGRLVVSSNGMSPGTGIVWGTYPVLGDANSKVVPGALVAYDATPAANGKLKQLFL